MYGAPMVNGAFANTFVMRPLLDTRRLQYHVCVGHERVLQLGTARRGRPHPHHMPVVLETEARCVRAEK